MLFNILKKQNEIYFDEVELLDEMQDFEIDYDQPAYFFMNKQTFNEWGKLYSKSLDDIINKDNIGILGYFCGRKIFQNEDLDFGEIEIR